MLILAWSRQQPKEANQMLTLLLQPTDAVMYGMLRDIASCI